MKLAILVLGPVLLCLGLAEPAPETAGGLPGSPVPGATPGPGAGRSGTHEVLQQYCVRCHGERLQRAGLSLLGFDVTDPDPVVAEKVIRKLRTGMMPPPGQRRPDPQASAALVEEIEARVDAAAAEPEPGARSFQRLNRAEYQSSIRELLDLSIDPGDYLPLDRKSANFDNIADTQILSATLLDAYLSAAAGISRLAVGDPDARPSSKTYTNPGYVSQWDRVEGAPRGTRGGISVVHNFVADGEYVFKLAFEHTTTGGFYGQTARGEQIEVSIDGRRAALLEVDRWMHVSDPNGQNMSTDPIYVTAGPHRVTAAFLRRSEGPVEDLLSRHEWSLVDRQIGVSGYGITALAHLKDLVVQGPYEPTGVSDTPSRQAIFTRRPTTPEEERPVAAEIIGRLAAGAWRRPVRETEIEALMGFYDQGASAAGPGTGQGFEAGVRTALQAILASPDFVFRFEEPAPDASPGGTWELRGTDLAARLSFFLWASPPDAELLGLAADDRLGEPAVLERQVRRMLADPRADALGSRFAAQWLRLEDLDRIHPDFLLHPDFHQQLAGSMRRETERFFVHLVREDRGALELLSADYTFVDERLGRHYGIPGVAGDHFRKVLLPGPERRGLLGHGSILALTSHANRTSPVLRGKWVMEVLLGSPPPPPPPDVPELDETDAVADGRLLTVRERLEMHRQNPACNSCHRMIDPIGVALENFDVTGVWRIKDNGTPIDARSELYDGTALAGPEDLRQALLQRPEALVRNLVENLMAYALGRRLEHYDMPTVRAIVRRSAPDGYPMSELILGVVRSAAFRMSRAATAGDERR